jgi:hypothetical protein
MSFKVAFEQFGIQYRESGDHHLYVAVARDHDGSGDLVPVIARDEWAAAIAAKSLSQKVLFVCQISVLLKALADSLEKDVSQEA